MTNYDNDDFKKNEIDIAASSVQEATQSDSVIIEAELREAAARGILHANPSENERLIAYLEIDDANANRIRALAQASRLDWELSQIIDEE